MILEVFSVDLMKHELFEHDVMNSNLFHRLMRFSRGLYRHNMIVSKQIHCSRTIVK